MQPFYFFSAWYQFGQLLVVERLREVFPLFIWCCKYTFVHVIRTGQGRKIRPQELYDLTVHILGLGESCVLLNLGQFLCRCTILWGQASIITHAISLNLFVYIGHASIAEHVYIIESRRLLQVRGIFLTNFRNCNYNPSSGGVMLVQAFYFQLFYSGCLSIRLFACVHQLKETCYHSYVSRKMLSN